MASIFAAMCGRTPVRCEMPSAETNPEAFPEHVKQVPLTPKMDKDLGFFKYKKYDESMGPFPETFDFVNQLKITEEQVNQSYEHQLPFHMNIDGAKKPTYSTQWERAVAYHQ